MPSRTPPIWRCGTRPRSEGAGLAQLSDDCFAFGGKLLSVEDAAALIEARVPPLGAAATVSLQDVLGRVLAAPLVARTPLPPFRNAAVDGYAFRHADLAAAGETTLRVAGRRQAGDAREAALPAGAAMRIFTGAPMPADADTVAMQEDVREASGVVTVPPGLPLGANARPVGEDVAAGAVALPAGRRLGPAEIGLAAALGYAALPLRPLVRVGVFSTGDELATPGDTLRPAQTYDSNRAMLLAMLRRLPVAATDLGILRDDQATIIGALREAAAKHDLLVTTGGVSTGEADHVRDAITAEGSLVFWRLAVKPGRPAAMGVVDGTPVLGLPGNPVAAVVTFLHLARPLVLRLAGAASERLPRFAARGDFAYRKKLGRREYVRVSLRYDDPASPLPHARKFGREGAGLLTSLTESDALAELAEDAAGCAPGDLLTVLPFAAIL